MHLLAVLSEYHFKLVLVLYLFTGLKQMTSNCVVYHCTSFCANS